MDSPREAPQASSAVPVALLRSKIEASSTAELSAPAPAEPLTLAPTPAEVPASVELISLEDDPMAFSAMASKANG
ncbi:hypothetical protein COCNU_scaffold001111G000030 [Cocos nucifera]|nr:hypothetical protein [Cocos nucifera]